MSALRLVASAGCALLLLAACADYDRPTVPRPKNLELFQIAGDTQFALPGTMLEESLYVRVTHIHTGFPVPGIEVVWSAIAGLEPEVAPRFSITDGDGRAGTAVRVAGDPGEHTITAAFDGIWGPSPRFTAYATQRPAVQSITPATASVGDTLTITGSHFFGERADLNAVRVAGRLSEVVSATGATLRAVVPRCLPSRIAPVTIALGPIISDPTEIAVAGDAAEPLALTTGTAIRLGGADTDRCLSIQPQEGNSSYLVIPQNASDRGDRLGFELVGVSEVIESTTPVGWSVAASSTPSPAALLEGRLRRREAELLERIGGTDTNPLAPSDAPLAWLTVPPPPLGHTRTFSALNVDLQPVPVTAVLRAVGERSLIYEDVRAPAGGLTESDFQLLADRFDDPIYPTNVEVFGEPSDLDGNGRVIILLTATVNEMTRPEDVGFVAGFFNSCDLLSAPEFGCTGNSGEILYTLVPDPEGMLGRPQPHDRVLRTIQSVLAHELQHMIHFNYRALLLGTGMDDLWLMEGLAHTAEELVAGVFRERGEDETAAIFDAANRGRAGLYLRNTAATTLLATSGFGTLEERGAGWLFVSYLRGRFGLDVLRRLTQTHTRGTANVDAATDVEWRELLSDWLVALYADGAPELVGSDIDARYTFPHMDLRQLLSHDDEYPLNVLRAAAGDFIAGGANASAAGSFLLIEENGLALNLLLGGAGGRPFPPDAERQLTIFRLR